MRHEYRQEVSWTEFIIILTTVSLLLIAFTGCYTNSKAAKQVHKAIDKKPLIALPIFRSEYPCVDTKADTTIITTDTTIWVDCPDTSKANDYFTVHDTVIRKVNNVITKTIKVPVTLPVKTVTIVKEVEDLSRVAEKDIQLIALQKKFDKQGESLSFYKKWFYVESFLLIALAVFFGIRLYSKLTIKKLLP